MFGINLGNSPNQLDSGGPNGSTPARAKKANLTLKAKLKGRRMLSAQEYRQRRSAKLLSNPEAQLDEFLELQGFFERQEPTYVKKIYGLAQLDNPIGPSCRMVIAIPAYNEGSRIKNTLEQYTKQDINPELFEIILFVTPAENDVTEDEVLRFKQQHPQVAVALVNNPREKNQPMGAGVHRRYAADIAMARILNRGSVQNNTILISNDADTVGMKKNYLSSILAELDRNPFMDGLVTRVIIPKHAMAKPNVAAYELKNTFEAIFSTGYLGRGKEKIPEPAVTNGRSTAVRASIYAAVGGYNPGAVIAQDWELGWLVADARDWNPDRIKYFDKTYLVTDPRRYLDCVVNRVPLDQDLLDSQIRPELRQLDNAKILDLIPNEFDWELFQDDVDSVWHSQYTGSNNRIGTRRFKLVFDALMESLGITYEVDAVNGVESVRLVDVDGFIKYLSGLTDRSDIRIIHSQPRVYTPEMVSELKGFFNTTTGYVEARNAKVAKIASKIRSARASDGQDIIRALKAEYERFAGHSYTPTRL